MDRKLIFKLRRFAVILVVILGILSYDIFTGIIHPALALLAISIGFMTGKFVGKYANVHWHPETNKVVSKLNRAGVVILVLYLSFSFSKKWIFGHWIHGPSLSAFSFGIASGVMAGRLITIRKQVRILLRNKGYLNR